MRMWPRLSELLVALAVVSLSTVAIAATDADGERPVSRNDIQRYIILGYPVEVPDGYRDWIHKMFYKAPQSKPWVLDNYNNRLGVEIYYPDMRMATATELSLEAIKIPDEGVIDVSISPGPFFAQSYYAREMQEQYEAGKCTAKKFGDICPDFFGWKHPDDEMIYLGTDYHFARCAIKKGTTINPSCEMMFILIDQIDIKIRFERRILSDVLKIRDNVFEHVCSWFKWPHDKGVDPAGRPLKINNCR